MHAYVYVYGIVLQSSIWYLYYADTFHRTLWRKTFPCCIYSSTLQLLSSIALL